VIVKTAIQQQWNIVFPNSGPEYTVLAMVDIDNKKWYTIHVSKDIATWTRTQPRGQWYEHPYEQPTRYNFHEPSSAKFDVHHELLAILKLTWG
jgi:hypothetical protein